MTRPLIVEVLEKVYKQDRPRATVIKGHAVVYDTKDSKDGKTKIAEATKIAIEKQKWEMPADEPLAIVVTTFFPIPKSFTKKDRAAALVGKIRPTSKPDLDNIEKIYWDGLVYGGAMRDDALIVEAHSYKFYAEEPKTVIVLDRVRKQDG